MTLNLLNTSPREDADRNRVTALTGHHNPYIAAMATEVLQKWDPSPTKEQPMDTLLTLPDIILKLKSIEIFEGLSVGELAAVASATEEISFDTDTVVIREGDPGDTLYLVLEGRVAVIKQETDNVEITLDHISAGDHFGEMALFEQIPRTATIRTTEQCRMLVLNKQEFNEMVREYPKIALEICKVFSGRIRKLHQRFTHQEPSGEGKDGN